MRLAYLLIVLPAIVVGIFYVAVFHSMGVEIRPGPFLGAAATFLAALFLVRRHQRRKIKRPGR